MTIAATGATAPSAPPTTSPYVTLQPPSPAGGIPGDANDPADLWGIGAALIGIILAIAVTRFVFRRGHTVVGPRHDRPERWADDRDLDEPQS